MFPSFTRKGIAFCCRARSEDKRAVVGLKSRFFGSYLRFTLEGYSTTCKSQRPVDIHWLKRLSGIVTGSVGAVACRHIGQWLDFSLTPPLGEVGTSRNWRVQVAVGSVRHRTGHRGPPEGDYYISARSKGSEYAATRSCLSSRRRKGSSRQS